MCAGRPQAEGSVRVINIASTAALKRTTPLGVCASSPRHVFSSPGEGVVAHVCPSGHIYSRKTLSPALASNCMW